MALDFTNTSIIYKANGKQIANNEIVTGIEVGTSREVNFSISFSGGDITGAKVLCQVLDAAGKEVSINFNSETYNGKFLFNGTYTINVTIYEDLEGEETQPNQKIFAGRKLTIEGCYTPLSSFNPDIIDRLSGTIIKNGTTFNDVSILPDLDQELPFDFQIDEYQLTRNGLVISYSPYGDRTISDAGDYNLKITIRRRGLEQSGDVMVKSFIRDFKLEKGFIQTITDADIFIFNDINKSVISNGQKYVEKDVILNWDISVGIETKSYVLNFYKDAKAEHIIPSSDGSIKINEDFSPILLGDFEPGATILSDYGIYKLDMVLQEYNNSKNRFNLTRYFIIERDVVRLNSNLIQCYDKANAQILATSENFTTDNGVIPLISYDEDLDDRVIVDVSVTFNGKPYKDSFDKDFMNGETVLREQGVYVLTGRVYERGATDNIKNNYFRTFTITVVQPPKDFSKIDVSLIYKETGDPVVNGVTLEPVETGYSFIVQPVKDSTVEVGYDYYDMADKKITVGDVVISKTQPLVLTKTGRYIVTLKIKDTTEDPNNPGKPLYTYNQYQKNYVISILPPLSPIDDDPDRFVYINGQLLDNTRSNKIWEILTRDSTESRFTIIKPGTYNILLINKNKFNFNYSINEHNITVIDPALQQKPTIVSDPPMGSTVAKEFKVYINYPASASKNSKMYKDLFGSDPDNWKSYSEESGITCTSQCKIVAKYQDTVTADWIELDVNEAFTPGPIIDTSPVSVPDTDIIGIVSNGKYYSVTIDAKRKMNYSYYPSIKLPGSSEFIDCKLGDTFKTEGSYEFKLKVVNDINGNEGTSNIIRFTIDHTDPAVPTILLNKGSISSNATTTGSVEITLGNTNYNEYLYEVYLNNRLFAKTVMDSNNLSTVTVHRDGVYYVTAVAIDKLSGRRSMQHSNFTIQSNKVVVSGVPIKPHRYQYDSSTGKFTFKDNITPYDGELLMRCNSAWKPLGDVGIYRDGIILNKLMELDVDLLQLEISTDNIEGDIIMNRTLTDSLDAIKKDLYFSLLRMMVENGTLLETVNNMETFCKEAEIPPLDPILSSRLEKDADFSIAKSITKDLNDLASKQLSTSRNSMINLIKDLQQNSSLIGELNWFKSMYIIKNNK